MAEKSKTARYIIDRYVYHTPGQQPHAIGSEQEFDPNEVRHLVEAGFMHRVGGDPDPTAVNPGQPQISQGTTSATVPPPPPAAPLNYETKRAPDA